MKIAMPMLRQIIRSGVPRAAPLTRGYSTSVAPLQPRNEPQSLQPPRRVKKDKQAIIGLRPSFRVPVNPNHGLYGFFRKKEKDGVVSYESLPDFNERLKTGRSWTAAELRRKSFRDLHTLWYILLRERNLCATQVEEGRRLGILPSDLGHKECLINARKCRKSMARIKFVLNERRLIYQGALKMFAEEKAALPRPPPQATLLPKSGVEGEKEKLREKLAELLERDRIVEIWERRRELRARRQLRGARSSRRATLSALRWERRRLKARERVKNRLRPRITQVS